MPNPPKLFLKFFQWYCNPRLRKPIEGDLLELYDERVAELGKRKADLKFIRDVLLLFRKDIIKPTEGSIKLNYYGMFKNNLKLGWRNMVKHKAFFAINISGLAIGIATCMVIMLFVTDELSYDRYNEKIDQIARIVLRAEVQGESINEAIVPAIVAPTFQMEFPEVIAGTRMSAQGRPLILYKNKKFRESRFAFADPNLFSVFTLPFIKGDPGTALKDPNSVVITESEAQKYFGDEDPMNKVLQFKEWDKQLKVTGVIEDIPSNSHFHFDLFGSMEGWEKSKSVTWMQGDFNSYLLLNKGTDISSLQSKIPSVFAKYLGPQLQDGMGITLEQFEESGNRVGLFLQPLADIHLHSDFAPSSELEPVGDINSVYIFSAIALFMLLIACVNFMNLSTAVASKRAKEVGIKKVLGSGRNQLLLQFLSESFISTFTAMLLAPLLVIASLPLFNTLTGKVFHASFFLSAQFWLYYVLFGLILSLLSGAYPAFLLSSFKPLAALRGKSAKQKGKIARSGLVILQFTLSTILIIGTIIVDQQMAFIQNKDIGYDKEGLIVIKDSWLLGKNQEVFKSQLLGYSQVENVTISGHIPAGPSNTSMTSIHMTQDSDDFRRTPVYYIDENYLPTMGITLLEGRNFSSEYGAESSNIIVNQTFLETFNLKDNPIGRTVKSSIDTEGGKVMLTIVGVIKDFHFKPLHEAVEPLIMKNEATAGLIVRAKSADIPRLLQDMEKMWDGFNSDEPFSYALLDELYRKTYLKEQGVGTLLRVFAFLTIFVASLGLFGLVTFTTEQRTKEIGIRKVLGSSVVKITSMLTYDFLRLVLISMVIAFPIGYIISSNWLENFAYRIEVEWWVFLASGLLTLTISWLTVSVKTLKAATVNPVDSLKDE